MSFKAWITEISNKEEWSQFDAAFVTDMENVNEKGQPMGYECFWEYALRIAEDLHIRVFDLTGFDRGEQERKLEAGTVVVGWTGDSAGSLSILPENLSEKTWLLDNLLEYLPEWHTEPDGPYKFGTRAEGGEGNRPFSRFLSSKGIVALFEDAE
jgi:hypothetical protein